MQDGGRQKDAVCNTFNKQKKKTHDTSGHKIIKSFWIKKVKVASWGTKKALWNDNGIEWTNV